MHAAMVRYVGYARTGLYGLGDTLRRIADTLIGRPTVAPIPVPVRNDPRR
jgi:hypothetical protein